MKNSKTPDNRDYGCMQIGGRIYIDRARFISLTGLKTVNDLSPRCALGQV